MHFTPIDEKLLFSKNDPLDPRRGEKVRGIKSVNELAEGVVIAGYPDDEGIRLNGGRVGASQGPSSLRRFLYRMIDTGAPIYDLGNVPTALPLAERHELARKACATALTQGHRWIGLGGGHDYAYGDGAGFLEHVSKSDQKPIIINFDAHLDVREPHPELNSGTAFFRLAQQKIDYDFVQIGTQAQCNSVHHRRWSSERGHKVLTLEDYWTSRVALDEYVIRELGDLLLRRRPAFVSVDMDAFAWPYAIGTSQSWPTGLEPREFWPCFQLLLKRLNVLVLGIYETSPPLDFDFGTSKLGAQIADTFLREVP